MADQPNNFNDKPTVYLNGFNVNPTFVDFQVFTYLNGSPMVTLNMSLITAKNLAKKILASIESYEQDFDSKVNDFDQLVAILEGKAKEQEKSAEKK